MQIHRHIGVSTALDLERPQILALQHSVPEARYTDLKLLENVRPSHAQFTLPLGPQAVPPFMPFGPEHVPPISDRAPEIGLLTTIYDRDRHPHHYILVEGTTNFGHPESPPLRTEQHHLPYLQSPYLCPAKFSGQRMRPRRGNNCPRERTDR